MPFLSAPDPAPAPAPKPAPAPAKQAPTPGVVRASDHGITHGELVARYIADGCTVISDGPSGTMLKQARKMSATAKVFIVLGVLSLAVFPPAILIFIGLALLEYYVLVKPKQVFISKD